MVDDIAQIAADLLGGVDRAVQVVGFEVAGALIEATPVDTGNARANWIISVGEPFEAVAGSRDAVDTTAQAAGEVALAAYTVDLGEVYITNNVAYLEQLIDGSSTQAAAGWDRAAIEQGVDAAIAKGGALL